jgi:hypothetical protein
LNWLNHTKNCLINTAEIDLNDHTIYFPYFLDDHNLINSIREAGIINPPMLKDLPEGKPIPVLGRRRIQAAFEIGLSQITVNVLPKETPIREAYEIAFWDNCSHRRFDDALKSIVIHNLLELFPMDRVYEVFLPVLGINPYGPVIAKFRAVGSLDDQSLELLSAGRILTKTAFTLTRMILEDREFILSLSGLPGMNANKFDEVAQSLYDLSIISNCTIRQLAENKELKDMLLSPQIAGRSKAEELRTLIRKWKFPELVEMDNAFRTWLKSFSLPKNISVGHTPSFEDDKLNIGISVNSYGEALEILDKLGIGAVKRHSQA